MKANNNITANKKYKDTMFRTLFGESKENAISLYNAVNNTDYTVDDGFEFTTLGDVIYMKMKNDVSFLIDVSMNLYEHQSTYNPNMPLRGFFYFADLYRQRISNPELLYGRRLLKIPAPKYIVFYNGPISDLSEDYKLLRLSDSFETPVVSGDYEWTATVININSGYNDIIMDKCPVLREYSEFVGMVKANQRTGDTLESAINRAVNSAINKGILKEFLEKHRREVVDMILTEFDEKRYEEVIREEEREEVMDMIAKQRRLEEKKNAFIMLKNGVSADVIKMVSSMLTVEEIEDIINEYKRM